MAKKSALSPKEKAKERADWANIKARTHRTGRKTLFKRPKGKDAEDDSLELGIPSDTAADQAS